MHPAQIAAVSCGGTPRQAYIYDVTSHLRVATLDESGSIAGSPSPIRAERSSRGVLSTAWGPSDDLLLWGSTLWDLRMPKVTGACCRHAALTGWEGAGGDAGDKFHVAAYQHFDAAGPTAEHLMSEWNFSKPSAEHVLTP